MRRLYGAAALALGLLAAPALTSALQAAPVKPATSTAKAHAKYVCPKCGMIAGKAGTCPHCKVALKRDPRAVAKYECAMCKIQSTKAGKCPKCEMPMKKIHSSR